MTGARYFTVEEARALLPKVSAIVEAQAALRERLERALSELQRDTGRPTADLTPSPTDPPAVRTRKAALSELLNEYQRAWTELEELGAVLKDARTGLVDFYSHIDGHPVFLCWRRGESDLGWYHDIDSGFAGRRPLQVALSRHYN